MSESYNVLPVQSQAQYDWWWFISSFSYKIFVLKNPGNRYKKETDKIQGWSPRTRCNLNFQILWFESLVTYIMTDEYMLMTKFRYPIGPYLAMQWDLYSSKMVYLQNSEFIYIINCCYLILSLHSASLDVELPNMFWWQYFMPYQEFIQGHCCKDVEGWGWFTNSDIESKVIRHCTWGSESKSWWLSGVSITSVYVEYQAICRRPGEDNMPPLI